MSKGRPFSDPEFKPSGRPFNDPDHRNYSKFNPEPEVEEREVEGLVVDEDDDASTVEDVVTDPAQDKGSPATPDPNVLNKEPDEEVEDPLVPTISGTDKGEKIKGTNKDDIIFGNLGPDKFKVKKGNDIILDFEVGVDSLKGKFRDVEFSMLGDSTLMEHKKGSVLFNGLELTAADIFG